MMVDRGPDIRADARWMTYEEAGRVLGIDSDSVARRARRSKWPRQPGNDGKTRVAIPPDALAESALPPGDLSAPDGRADNASNRGPDIRPDNALADAVAVFREVEARLRAERDAARAEAAEQCSRAARIEGELDGMKTAAEHLHEVAAQARREERAAQDRAAEALRRAEEADRKAIEARQEIARLRARGLLARLRNRL